jgi:hypothetical protein
MKVLALASPIFLGHGLLTGLAPQPQQEQARQQEQTHQWGRFSLSPSVLMTSF